MDWKRMIPAARWAVAEKKRREANPQSVLDLGGNPVPWSEVVTRFPELMTSDAPQNRVDFYLAHCKVTRRKPRPEYTAI